MRAKRFTIMADQLLRAKGLGDDRLDNPRYYTFRKTWSKMYYHFRPEKWYWELVILARKCLISFTAVMFRTSSDFQLAMALLVLFASYVLHAKHQPYMTHLNREDVINSHVRAALTDPLHASIEVSIHLNNRGR
jgi:hypothetical protein